MKTNRTIVLLFALVITLSMSITNVAAVWETTPVVADTSTNAGTETATAISETKVETIAAFKSQVVALVNAERAKLGLSPLVEAPKLNNMADVRAKESVSSFSHIRPDGTICSTIFAEYSLNYKSAGENLAYGYKTAVETVNAWMNSPEHRANILSGNYVYIGIGVYTTADGATYCSQLFYTPKG
jgi:uncharacterized protein YkwD